MVGLAFMKWAQRDWACRMASGSWNLDKMVADHMQCNHQVLDGAPESLGNLYVELSAEVQEALNCSVS
jgi:hypothetical protein